MVLVHENVSQEVTQCREAVLGCSMFKGNVFDSVKLTKPKTNWFNLSHDIKLSVKMGELFPIMTLDCLPGEKIKFENQILGRLAPLVTPMMHKVDIRTRSFFVPYRLLWENWEKFITGDGLQNDGEVQPAFPYMSKRTFPLGSVADYLGVPIDKEIDKISAMYFAAYNLIYNEYFRDQNLIDPLPYKLLDGENTILQDYFKDNPMPRKKAWSHDYFTSCFFSLFICWSSNYISL